MRKIDLERSRDYYKKILNITLNTMAEMAKCFERMEASSRKRIQELEDKLRCPKKKR